MWIELTSPWEENLTKTHFEKIDKYNKIGIDLQEGKPHGVKWTVMPLCVEVRSKANEQRTTLELDVESASANVQSVG